MPTGFRYGGCTPKFGPPSIPGPPPKKKFSVKQKIFLENVGDRGVDVIFSKTKVPEIFRKTTFFQKFPQFSAKKSSFLKHFAIPACQGPLPASWAPLFYYFFGGGGCYTPTPPPPPCLRLIVDDHSYSGPGLSG